MLEEVDGFILTETPYGETSKIINVLTREKGIVGIMAKGARSLKSPLRTVSTKLTYGTFIIYYKKDKLSTLKEVNVIDSFNNVHLCILSVPTRSCHEAGANLFSAPPRNRP